jgi:hypothetical protein
VATLSPDYFPLAAAGRKNARLMGMEVRVTAETEKKLAEFATLSGMPVDDVVEAALTGYFDELAETRNMLDSRYDDIKSGKVKLIDGEEVEAYFREKSAALRAQLDS